MTTLTLPHIILFFASLAISLVVSGLMIRFGLNDEPNARSSHDIKTPTAGGVGLLAALALGGSVCLLNYPHLVEMPQYIALLIIAIGVGLIGLRDDFVESRAGPKFLILMGLSLISAYLIGPADVLPIGGSGVRLPWTLGWLGTALWIFVVMNVVNFVDGANGFATSLVCIAASVVFGLGLLLGATQAMVWSVLLMAGICGFLPFNFRHTALIFFGDVGALLAGFMLAVSVLFLAQTSPQNNYLYVGPIVIMPILTDVFMTLVHRLRRGENLFKAHQHHLYQRAIKTGRPHLHVTGFYIAATLVYAAIAFILVRFEKIGSLAWLLIIAAISAGLFEVILKRVTVNTVDKKPD